jgi:hypothetical protein
MQFAIDLLFTHAAGDQLSELRTEIKDQDFLVGHDEMHLFSSKRKKCRNIRHLSEIELAGADPVEIEQ